MKFIARSDTTMTTYNNIRTARSPITGMTIAEVAHWTRWCETDEGKARWGQAGAGKADRFAGLPKVGQAGEGSPDQGEAFSFS